MYYNLRNCQMNNCKWDKVLYGKSQSRFGFSMTSLGDINKDGYNDVAIGAPYENDHGTVYVYLGSANGLNAEPSQVRTIRFTNVELLKLLQNESILIGFFKLALCFRLFLP